MRNKNDFIALYCTRFIVLGDLLIKQYKGATKVKVSKGGRLRLAKKHAKMPTANDLIYINRSPDYCTKNVTIGITGKRITTTV